MATAGYTDTPYGRVEYTQIDYAPGHERRVGDGQGYKPPAAQSAPSQGGGAPAASGGGVPGKAVKMGANDAGVMNPDGSFSANPGYVPNQKNIDAVGAAQQKALRADAEAKRQQYYDNISAGQRVAQADLKRGLAEVNQAGYNLHGMLAEVDKAGGYDKASEDQINMLNAAAGDFGRQVAANRGWKFDGGNFDAKTGSFTFQFSNEQGQTGSKTMSRDQLTAQMVKAGYVDDPVEVERRRVEEERQAAQEKAKQDAASLDFALKLSQASDQSKLNWAKLDGETQRGYMGMLGTIITQMKGEDGNLSPQGKEMYDFIVGRLFGQQDAQGAAGQGGTQGGGAGGAAAATFGAAGGGSPQAVRDRSGDEGYDIRSANAAAANAQNDARKKRDAEIHKQHEMDKELMKQRQPGETLADVKKRLLSLKKKDESTQTDEGTTDAEGAQEVPSAKSPASAPDEQDDWDPDMNRSESSRARDFAGLADLSAERDDTKSEQEEADRKAKAAADEKARRDDADADAQIKRETAEADASLGINKKFVNLNGESFADRYDKHTQEILARNKDAKQTASNGAVNVDTLQQLGNAARSTRAFLRSGVATVARTADDLAGGKRRRENAENAERQADIDAERRRNAQEELRVRNKAGQGFELTDGEKKTLAAYQERKKAEKDYSTVEAIRSGDKSDKVLAEMDKGDFKMARAAFVLASDAEAPTRAGRAKAKQAQEKIEQMRKVQVDLRRRRPVQEADEEFEKRYGISSKEFNESYLKSDFRKSGAPLPRVPSRGN